MEVKMSKTQDIELLRFLNLSDDKQAAKMEALRDAIVEDEDFRFSRIKLDGKKPRYELPAPVKGDPDNVEIESTFQGVVLLAKKNFYQSDEDKENGVEPKEKRALYVLRLGRYVPELFYISPTSVRNWKYFVKDIVTSGRDYFGVLVEFSAEVIKGQKYTWTKPKFSIVRTLTKDELAHVTELREIVSDRVSQYESDADLDKYEDEALSVDRKGDRVKESDDVSYSKRKRADVEDDEDDDTPAAPVNKGRKAASKKQEDDDDDDDLAKAKPKGKKFADDDDDDEDEKPSRSRSAKSHKQEDDGDDDEPEGKSGKGGRASYPSLDDDDED
jgi:hypothetical protein